MVEIEPMTPDHAARVLEIYEQGIATGVATFDTAAPDWSTWDAAHRPDGRFVAVSDGDIAGADLELRPVEHLRAKSAAEDDAEVVVLAALCAGSRLDVDGPAPTGLVGHPADDRVVEFDDIDATVGERPDIARFAEPSPLETHGGSLVRDLWGRSCHIDRP